MLSHRSQARGGGSWWVLAGGRWWRAEGAMKMLAGMWHSGCDALRCLRCQSNNTPVTVPS